MEAADGENALLLHLQPTPPVVASEYASDGSVDINKQPALKKSTGNWRACYPVLGVGFSECMLFSAIATNLVTLLTTVLHESKVDAARNISSWAGVCYLTPLLGAFVADSYLGRYWTMVVFLPVYIVAMLVLISSASLPMLFQSDVHPALVYLGLYLAAIASGGVKPCISAFGADQFDVNDPVELVKKGSFFNWYFFLTTTSSLLSGTVIVWLQDNVGWAVSYVIPTVLMFICFPAFLAGSRVYRFRKMGVSPLTSILQVVFAAVRKWHIKLPDDSSLLYEQANSPSTTEASHKNKHTNQFRFFDKAAIVVPSGNESTAQTSPWRLCTVTQVEELKMLLSTLPTWASFVVFYAVTAQMQSTMIEQGMLMDNHVGSFAIPPASMPIIGVLSFLICVAVYETILVPSARRFTGNEKGFSQWQRLGIGQALSILTMALAALLETRRLAIAEANGLRHQEVPVPMSILWQGPVFFVHGAAEMFGSIGMTEFFYDQAPVTMKSLCAAFGQLAIASGSYFNSAVLSVVAFATTRGSQTGWIPDNLNEGHLDYFFWMMAALSLLNLALFVRYSMRHGGKAT
ncbi:protein NRT1/ PTR FAMILY 8.3-like isoform X1 [Miscanthus floridulus]|uniref:protein NRT1/ PTR FAMILY 8.3-like isoform X1 n=2 Tax=Miscanthus floridulus TaxID=154761 RepID=UPI003459DE2A